MVKTPPTTATPDQPKKMNDTLQFFVGFFGNYFFLIVILPPLLNSIDTVTKANGDMSASILPLVIIGAFVFSIVYFYRKGLRFIALGIACSVLVPLLLFGGCLLTLMTQR